MKLHLGGGKRYIPGFVHVDLADFPHIDHRQDIKDLSNFENGSVDLIYACHVLEYFDREEVTSILKEWRRVLRQYGWLRLAVPDFDKLLLVYRETNGDLSKILGPLYGRWEIPGTNDIIYHKTVYTHASLGSTLLQAGFKIVREWDWTKTEHTEVDDYSQAYYPHMQKGNGIHISLNLEAQKR